MTIARRGRKVKVTLTGQGQGRGVGQANAVGSISIEGSFF